MMITCDCLIVMMMISKWFSLLELGIKSYNELNKLGMLLKGFFFAR